MSCDRRSVRPVRDEKSDCLRMISGWFARLTSLILGEWVPKVLRGSVQKWVRQDHGAEWFEMDSDKRKRFSALIGKCSSSRSATSE